MNFWPREKSGRGTPSVLKTPMNEPFLFTYPYLPTSRTAVAAEAAPETDAVAASTKTRAPTMLAAVTTTTADKSRDITDQNNAGAHRVSNAEYFEYVEYFRAMTKTR